MRSGIIICVVVVAAALAACVAADPRPNILFVVTDECVPAVSFLLCARLRGIQLAGGPCLLGFVVYDDLCVVCGVWRVVPILLPMVGSLGYDDVGFRSHQIRTPNIDKVASEGRVLTNYYGA